MACLPLQLRRARTLDVTSPLRSPRRSYLWMAPECIRHEAYDSRADMWSFGVLLVELLTQQRPYAALYATPVQIALQVGEGALRPATPPSCPPGLDQMLDQIFQADPLERPSFGLVVTQLESVVAAAEARHVAASAQDASVAAAWSGWFKGGAAKLQAAAASRGVQLGSGSSAAGG